MGLIEGVEIQQDSLCLVSAGGKCVILIIVSLRTRMNQNTSHRGEMYIVTSEETNIAIVFKNINEMFVCIKY